MLKSVLVTSGDLNKRRSFMENFLKYIKINIIKIYNAIKDIIDIRIKNNNKKILSKKKKAKKINGTV